MGFWFKAVNYAHAHSPGFHGDDGREMRRGHPQQYQE